MKIIEFSEATPLSLSTPGSDVIHVLTQFFVHQTSGMRNQEIQECLRRHVDHPDIAHIHLLNERLYTDLELGVTSSKIRQHVVGTRLRFAHVLEYVRRESLKGYLVMTNADIFFDATLANVHRGPLRNTRSLMAQLRYEYRGDEGGLETAPIFGPRFDSQDAWIWHSNHHICLEDQERAFNIDFGRPGCDNKLIYLFKILGFVLYNDPACVKCYHYHCEVAREYVGQEPVPNPWGALAPHGYPVETLPLSLGINPLQVLESGQNLWFSDNDVLYHYVEGRLREGRAFVVPRISGIENNVAMLGAVLVEDKVLKAVAGVLRAMKNNAGIQLSTGDSIRRYAIMYLTAFRHAELYGGWDVQGNYIGHIAQSHAFIRQTFIQQNQKMFWALALDVFHYVQHARPWTWALRGRRVLLVTPFGESILEKIPIRHRLWGSTGVDLFPECTFVTVAPPMTQADEPSREFHVELAAFCKRLDALHGKYDVALVSAGGYGNLICDYIFTRHRKSSIYVGGVLQMYFGILGCRWIKERPDVLRLYMNEYWSRPKLSERPRGCDNVEGGCYW